MNEHTTALYIRLSQEDDNIGESNSVKNQRDLLNDFISKHPELSKSKILYFVDDGYSGTNFNRPAVTDMLEQARKGKIQSIVVKDFSRFGRNYIEVGGYLEQVFPFLGVRFLSVNDLFDSNNNQGRSAGLEVGFKTLIHDLYSKDLSVKSTTGKIAKTKRGEHIGGTAPYGYRKSKTVKNAWVIDEAAATTIRRIFDLALEGLTVTKIAQTLNAENILSPLMYRKKNNTHKEVIDNSVGGVSLWKRENVTRIVRDERYTGKNISGKLQKTSYGAVKTKLIPKSEWLVVADAHESIVSQETFDKAQSMLGLINQRTLNRVNTNLFARKIFCGHCGYGLRRYSKHNSRPNSKYAPRYVCRSSIEHGLENCLKGTVMESYISEVVLKALRMEILLAQAAKQQTDKQNNVLLKEHEKLSVKLKRLTHELERLKNGKEQLFENYANGKLTKEQYIKLKAEHSNNIKTTEADIEKISNEIWEEEQSVIKDTNCDILNPCADAKEVTAVVMALIKRINVFADSRFEIEFSFSR